LLFKESHLFNKLQGANILKQIMNFLIMGLLDIAILFITGIEFLLMFIVEFHGFFFVLFISCLKINLELLLCRAHLLLEIVDSLLESLFPFFVVGLYDRLNARRCLR